MDKKKLDKFSKELKKLLAKYEIGLQPVIQFFDDPKKKNENPNRTTS